MNLHARGSVLINRDTNSESGTGVAVTYTRDGTGHAMTATVARLTPDATTPPVPGARLDDRERDFYVVYADLVTAGLNEPQTGDRITLSGVTYEMHKPQTQPPWAWADWPHNTRVVIHTRRKG